MKHIWFQIFVLLLLSVIATASVDMAISQRKTLAAAESAGAMIHDGTGHLYDIKRAVDKY
ncbi:MAG: hypothetical protein KGL39_24915 [Patescibacteria group bacterium]|nr:hypothetical protein [Patescibacteria group bacterium]